MIRWQSINRLFGVTAIAAGVLLLGQEFASLSSRPITFAQASEVQSVTVQIQVSGAVKKPGIYRLPAGARIMEAITAAGGVTKEADLDALELASPVSDSQKVHVPKKGSPAIAPSLAPRQAKPPKVGTAMKSSPGMPLNLNTATAAELNQLPGIGERLAADIVAYRQKNGPFKHWDQLGNVPGIGTKRLEKLKKLLRL